MSRTQPSAPRSAPRRALATVSVGVLVALLANAWAPAGGAAAAVPTGGAVATAPVPSPTATLLTSLPSTPSTGAPSPAGAGPSAAPPTPEPPPVDPLAGLGKKERAAFRRCLSVAVGPGSGGPCAALLQKKLKQVHLHPWAVTGRMTVAGVNAVLNYQRSRGLKPTGVATRATWLALAARAPALPVELPKKCLTKGIVICVDQGHRRLFWMRDGKVVRTVKVRLGGYNSHPKTGTWRVFPTANGTWRVYDKQVDPKSENYGSGAMPYSVMFYPDMYVHYSPGFHSVGYAGSSHGCVNVGSLSDAIWIFRHTPIGTRVHIFTPRA